MPKRILITYAATMIVLATVSAVIGVSLVRTFFLLIRPV